MAYQVDPSSWQGIGGRIAKARDAQNKWGGDRFGTLSSMAQQGYSGRGYTGGAQNLSDLTGEERTYGGETYAPTTGKTWQDIELGGVDPQASQQTVAGVSGELGTGGDVSTGGYAGGVDTANTTIGTTPGYSPMLGGGTVADIYRNQLGREGDAEGMAWYQQQVDSGAMTIDQVRAAIQASEEGEGYTNPNEAWLDQQFTDQFGRVTDVEGRNYYSNLLRQGYSPEEVQQMIAGGAQGTDPAYTGESDVGGDRMIDAGSGISTTDPTASNPTIGDVTGGDVPYGQVGFEQAVTQGRTEAEDYLTTGYDEALGAVDPYAAATGALGPEAEQEFYDNYEMSPGQQWLQEQGQTALARQRNMLGKSMGGGTQIALQRDATGFAMQDMDKYLERLGVSTTQRAEIMGRRGETLGDLAYTSQTEIARQRMDTGNNLANDIIDAGSSLTNLDANYGAALADLIAAGTLSYQEIIDGLTTGTAADQAAYLNHIIQLAQTGAQGAGNIELGKGGEGGTPGWADEVAGAAAGAI